MNKRSLIVAAVAAMLLLALAGIAAATVAVVPSEPARASDAVAAVGLPPVFKITATVTGAPSAISTAAAMTAARTLAGPSVAAQATSIRAQHVVFKDESLGPASGSGVSAWMVTYEGLTLYPSVPVGVVATPVAGMNHTEIIDANTGEVIKGMEYLPRK